MWANCLRCVFFRFRPMGLPVNLLSITLEMSSRTFPELTIRIIVSVAVGWTYVTCCEKQILFPYMHSAEAQWESIDTEHHDETRRLFHESSLVVSVGSSPPSLVVLSCSL